ncbi:MAG: diacylglycerol kinase family protein [Actinomycetota bacterium]
MAPRVAVVVNPTSGRGRAERSLPEVRRLLASIPGSVEVLISEGPDHAPKLARDAAERGAEIVAAMGGDGMVGMVGTALIGSPAALGLIPTGTGNDFAVALGYRRRRPLDGVEAMRSPRLLEIDAARIRWQAGEQLFINVAGTGFDSEVNDAANRMKSRVQGTAKYVAAVVKTLPGFRAGTFEVTIDGERRTLPGMMIAVGNGVSYGGGMKVTPKASFTDGLLDLTVIGTLPKAQFLWHFPKVFRGTHLKLPMVTSLRGRRIEISADREFEVYADGERVGPLPATFEVIPRALRVVQPPTH